MTLAFLPTEYGFTVEAIHYLFITGLLVSYIYYKKTNISCGGSLAVAYLGASILWPVAIVSTIVIALISYVTVKRVVLRLWLPRPRQIFGIGLLVGIFYGAIWLAVATAVFGSDSVPSQIAIVGVIIPGMLCNSFNKQGVAKTLVPMVWMLPLTGVVGLGLASLSYHISDAGAIGRLFVPTEAHPTLTFALTALSVLMAVLIQDGPFSKLKLRTGGYVTVGLIVATIGPWQVVVLMAAAVLVTYLVFVNVTKLVPAHGKDRFVVLIMISSVSVLTIEYVLNTLTGVQFDGARNIVYCALPAIVANDLIQYGPKKTAGGMAISALVTGAVAIPGFALAA